MDKLGHARSGAAEPVVLRYARVLSVGALVLAGILLAMPQWRPSANVDLPVVGDPRLFLLNTPNVSLIEYEVSGDDPLKLRESLNQRGPKHSSGKSMDAYTQWKVDWSWPSRDARPDIRSLKTNFSVNVLLPRWKERDSASAEDRNRWDTFLRDISRHEIQHVQYALNGIPLIEKEVRQALDDNPQLTAQEANNIAQSVLNRIREKDLWLDETTGHGRTQGVQFP